jgi:CHASE3 domain sensor protein
MPTQSFTNKCADIPLFRNFPRYAGAAVALFGLLIITSWYAHWQSILQMLPDTAPMQYNTALCFILSGAGLYLLTTSRAKISSWLGGAAASIALLTLLQYLTGRDFGIDQIFFKPFFFEVATAYPGRMSPLSAVCFIFIGTGILLVGAKKQWSHRLTAAAMLACVVGVIGLVAIAGFVFGIEAATGWGADSRIAINTSVAFLLLGIGLLIWSCQAARRENFNFLRWLPVTGAVTLMAMIAFVSTVNTMELKKATFWRQHTIQVILNAQLFEENLIDLQRGTRGYVTMGDTNALAAYESSADLEPPQFNQLAELTRDNPIQQRRLKKLADAMADVFTYDKNIISLYQQQGSKTALEMDVTGQKGRIVFGDARGILKAFSQEEQRLLYVRDALEQADSHNAASLLIFGSVLAAVLLVIASYMTTREMNRRRRGEIEREKLIGELQQALAEVKTLSGMIPICGWCKSIRSDKGYWQTVEQYVGTHTDATFSHGMCPSCAEKFKADILKTNARQAV